APGAKRNQQGGSALTGPLYHLADRALCDPARSVLPELGHSHPLARGAYGVGGHGRTAARQVLAAERCPRLRGAPSTARRRARAQLGALTKGADTKKEGRGLGGGGGTPRPGP